MVLLFCYLIGTVNGIGYSIYIGEWFTAALRRSAVSNGIPHGQELLGCVYERLNTQRQWR